jgi:hypothetical protein
MRTSTLIISAALSAGVLITAVAQSAGPGYAPKAPKAAASTPPPPPLPELRDPDALPAFNSEPFPEEKSKAPTLAEWKTATRLKATRVTRGLSDCATYRLREWIKIHCSHDMTGIRLIAGSNEGVAMWVPEVTGENRVRGGELIFPVRRGDNRFFELFDLIADWDRAGSETSGYVEERWLDGETSPTLAVVQR